jgi:RND superfamily putative drug exporter
MVSVFASFLLTSDPLVKMFGLGLGLAAAIVIAATIVLCLLVPAR